MQNIQTGQLQQRGGFRNLVDAVFHGLLADDLRTNQGVERLGTLLLSELAGGLAGDGLDVLIVEILRDVGAIHEWRPVGEVSAGELQATVMFWAGRTPGRIETASRRMRE